MARPDTVKFLARVGVDVVAFVEYMDFLFKNDQTYTYQDFLSMLLELRGTNTVTVKDVMTLRKWLDSELTTIKGLAQGQDEAEPPTPPGRARRGVNGGNAKKR